MNKRAGLAVLACVAVVLGTGCGGETNGSASAETSTTASAISGSRDSSARVLRVLTPEQDAAVDEAIVLLSDGLQRLAPGAAPATEGDITCAEWLAAPRDILLGFARGIVGDRRSAAADAAMSEEHLVARIDLACRGDRSDSAVGWIARELLLATGQDENLEERDRIPTMHEG